MKRIERCYTREVFFTSLLEGSEFDEISKDSFTGEEPVSGTSAG